MKKCVLGLLPVFWLASSIESRAQENSFDNFTGGWTSDATWQDGSAPSTTDVGSTDENFNIRGYVSVGSSASPMDLTFVGNKAAYTFTVYDTLVVYGDMIFNTDAMTLSVPSGGLLIVFGNLDINNKVDLSSDGTVIVTGELKLTGGQATIDGSGNFYADDYSQNAQDEIPPDQARNIADDLQNDFPDLYNFVSCGGACSLPIELQDYKAEIAGSSVMLSWATTKEENFDRFVIERSSNGTDYHVLDSLQGAGENISGLLTQYVFEDRNPLLGLNYYRLKAVDLDNAFEFFGPMAVKFEGSKIVSISPNPSKGDHIGFEFNFIPSTQDRIILINQLGVELVNSPLSEYSETFIQFDQKLDEGIYFLKYVGVHFQTTTRIVINGK